MIDWYKGDKTTMENFMSSALVFARAGNNDVALLSQFANRHGLIAGATGTGKTVSLQKLAELFAAPPTSATPVAPSSN